MTLVSVIIPCYNCESFIHETIDSVLKSSYTNLEIILVNDGSEDNTANIIEILALEYESIFCFHIENSGPSVARNLAIKSAKGEIILPLDSDDKIDSEYIFKAINLFKQKPDLKVVYCNAQFFGDKNNKWLLPKFSLELLAQNNMIFISSFFKKADWEKIKGFDENMLTGIEDWDFWIRMLQNGGEVHRIEYIGFYYRIYGKSRSDLLYLDDKEQKMNTYIFNKHKDFFLNYLPDPINLFHDLDKVNTAYLKLQNKPIVKMYLSVSNFIKKLKSNT